MPSHLRRLIFVVSVLVLSYGVLHRADAECPGDITGNGVVNGADLGLVLAAWGSDGTDEPESDINADGIVNGADLGVVLATWGLCFTVPNWGTLIEAQPDPAVVWDAELRAAITATGLAWRVKDTATQIEMLLIPPGTFEMGCSASELYPCYDNEYPKHTVTLTNAFYLGRYEVTQGQWRARMGSNPSAYADLEAPDWADRPVDHVSWNLIAGSAGFMARTGMRLPKEAEWEYAYRAGTTTAFHGFMEYPSGTDDDGLASNIGFFETDPWCDFREGELPCMPIPVGLLHGNGFGLHDMAGNVQEWVNDWYGDYSAEAQVNPQGHPSGQYGPYRVIRGGDLFQPYMENARNLRASFRAAVGPGSGGWIGFRLARDP